MEKTSKIIKSEFKNEWTGQNGIVYYHTLELENGDKGSIGTKSKNPDKLAVGQELIYTIENDKIKAVNKQFVKGGVFKSEPFEHKCASHAMAYAKDLIVGGKVEIKDLLATSDKIYNWLISKKID